MRSCETLKTATTAALSVRLETPIPAIFALWKHVARPYSVDAFRNYLGQRPKQLETKCLDVVSGYAQTVRTIFQTTRIDTAITTVDKVAAFTYTENQSAELPQDAVRDALERCARKDEIKYGFATGWPRILSIVGTRTQLLVNTTSNFQLIRRNCFAKPGKICTRKQREVYWNKLVTTSGSLQRNYSRTQRTKITRSWNIF